MHPGGRRAWIQNSSCVWLWNPGILRVQVNGANQHREKSALPAAVFELASHFHPFPHRLLGRDGSRFPRLSSATHLALFKQFHPQNMCSSYNMGARRGPCVGSGAPRGWDMASLHPSAPQRVLLGEPADVTRTCVTMEWFVKPETALRLGSSEAGRTGWEFSTPAATAVSVLEAQFSPFSSIRPF